MTLNITLGLVDQVRDIAHRAGDAILEVYGTDFAVEAKDDASPVTVADQKAEALILAAIRDEITGAFPIIAEEEVAAGRVPDIGDGPFWLIDPLDGTKQFVQRRGEFTVNIALVDNGLPVLGVVHAPAIGATYWGSQNGAFAQDDGGDAHAIACRLPPADGLTVVVSRSHRTPETDAYLANFTVREEITSGSSIKLCLVAAGRADVYPRMGRTMEWDTAAGHGVLRYAGGSLTTVDGGPFRYGKPGFENPPFIARGLDAEIDAA